jgi:hypothetical protein
MIADGEILERAFVGGLVRLMKMHHKGAEAPGLLGACGTTEICPPREVFEVVFWG